MCNECVINNLSAVPGCECGCNNKKEETNE